MTSGDNWLKIIDADKKWENSCSVDIPVNVEEDKNLATSHKVEVNC